MCVRDNDETISIVRHVIARPSLDQLRFDLQRTSELLFDWTNGQAALGQIEIYHGKERWETADIRIFAKNNLRPHATIGGIVTHNFSAEIGTGSAEQTVMFSPGHVDMGATWNRFGEAGSNLSDDWARTLAHELGHYICLLYTSPSPRDRG